MQIAERYESNFSEGFHNFNLGSHIQEILLGMFQDLELLSWDTSADRCLKELRYNFFRLSKMASTLGLDSISLLADRGEREVNISLLNDGNVSDVQISNWNDLLHRIEIERMIAQEEDLFIPSVLVIADNPEQLQFQEDLTYSGIKFAVSSDVSDIKNQVQKYKFTCFIIDIDSDSFFAGDMIHLLKNSSKNASTPIVAVSEKIRIVDNFGFEVNQIVSPSTSFDEISVLIGNLLHDIVNTRSTIFVAEFNESFNDELKEMLREEHIKVVSFDNIKILPNRLLQEMPDMLLIGNVGNYNEGLSLCRRIKTDKRFSNVDVLIMTETVDPHVRDSIFKSGADDYIIAPFALEELAERMYKRISLKKIMKNFEKENSNMANTMPITRAIKDYLDKTDFLKVADDSDNDDYESESDVKNRILTPKVLIADDNPLACNLLSRHFKHEGWDVKIASNGDEVIKMLKEERFHVVLMDIYLSYKSGFEILLWIRQNGLNKYLKTVLLTSQDQRETERRAFALGASDFMSKPFNPETVTKRLKRFLPAV